MIEVKPSEAQKILAASLSRLAAKQLTGFRPANSDDSKFEHTGWLLLRCAVVMIEQGDWAFRLAADWCARGYPNGSSDPKVHQGQDVERLTSVEAASQQSDEWEKQRDQLGLLRAWLDDNARDLESRIAYTVRVLPNEGRRDSLIECANRHCDTTMTGFGEDRPKRGRCPRCYQFQLRNNRDWTPNGLDVAS